MQRDRFTFQSSLWHWGFPSYLMPDKLLSGLWMLSF